MAETSTFLIRFSGDLSTKRGRAFARFRSRLAANIRDALQSADLPFDLRLAHNRFFLDAPPEAGDLLATVFGLQSYSRSQAHPWETFDDLVQLGEECFAEAVKEKTFAVRIRRGRVRGQVDWQSADLERALGARLFPLTAGVDLDNPQVTATIELDPKEAHFFSTVVPGPAGLPLRAEGRCLTLISGGIDSAAAAWLMLKRGILVDYLFYNLGGSDHESQVLEVVDVLARRWSHGYRPRIWLVDLRPLVEELKAKTPESLWQVILKRVMLIGANTIADKARAGAIVTGEAIGQVSSQTLDNLAAIEAVADLPVLRPLLTFDKYEIVALARRIGSYDLSASVPEYCALQGRGPAIAATTDELDRAEEALDLRGFVDSLADAPRLDLRGRTRRGQAAAEASLAVSEVPESAVVIDLRSSAAFATWHYPGALRMDYSEAARACAHFDAKGTYVICCEVEFKSADIAEKLQAAGRKGSFFAGGTSKLLRWAETQNLVDAASVAPATRD